MRNAVKTADEICCGETPLLVQDGDGVAARSAPPTKSRLLAELLRRPGAYDQIDSAWRLAMWLMLVEDGVAVCGYGEMAERLGNISRHTVKKWADSLEAKGVLERKPKGNRMELRLTGDHMRIAAASDAIHVEGHAVRRESPAVLSMVKIAEGAKELGARMTITINGCDLGVGK